MSARSGCGTAHPDAVAGGARRGPVARGAVVILRIAGLTALLLGAAAAQQPGLDLLAELARTETGRARAETALILAHVAPESADALARRAIEDRDPRARALGLIALGKIASPGSEVVIGRVFESADDDDLERMAAAYALGLLPDERPAPAVDRYLARVEGSGYRRHRDTLAALVLGHTQTPHPTRRASLQSLLDDDSNQDAGLRALAVLALRNAGEQLTAEQVDQQLDSEWPLVRLATVRALAARPDAVSEVAARLATTASDDDDPRVRAAALELLVATRQRQALELADGALRGRDAERVAAGVSATTQLGGGALRDQLAAAIAVEQNVERKVAMFGAWRGSVPPKLADAALRFATDGRHSLPARAIALHLLAREGDERAVPLLHAIVTEGEDGATIAGAIDDLRRLGADSGLADRLGKDGDVLRKIAPRLEALFRLERPEAVALLREALDSDRLGVSARADLLRSWRRALMPPPAEPVLATLPRPLANLLR